MNLLGQGLKSLRAPHSPQRTWAENDGRSPTIAFSELATRLIVLHGRKSGFAPVGICGAPLGFPEFLATIDRPILETRIS
jgi:hypothetical protein